MKRVLFAAFIFAAGFISGGNRADYKFEVEYDHAGKMISGYADLTYCNFSDDTINEMKFHMYANLFRRESSFFRKKPSEERCGSIDADSIFIGGKRSGDMKIDNTMGSLKLEEPLLPGCTLKMRIYFRNRIPAPFLREGWSPSQSDITQWYPKIAVYKDGAFADFQYTKDNEFFNEYGDYELDITLPSDMYLFGTGRLVSPESEIEAIDSLSADSSSKKSSAAESGSGFTSKKRLVYRAENVSDMAFIITKDPAVIRETREGITVTVTCARERRKVYEKEIDGIFDALSYFSKKYFPYPYEQITVSEGLLQAGSGMEYPLFIILGPAGTGIEIPFIKSYALESVISHEIGHQWFYLISGSNETEEPFMDEGLNTYAEVSYLEDKYGKMENFIFMPHVFSATHFDFYYYTMRHLQNSKKSVPLSTDAITAGKESSIILYYAKGYLAAMQMEDMTGKAKFDSIMKDYFEKNAFTHTDIKGFLSHLNSATGDAYYRQFNSILYENYANDFYFEHIEKDTSGGFAVIGNRKFFDISVPLYVEMENGEKYILRKREGNDTIFLPDGKVRQMIIDPEKKYMDIDYHNNSMKGAVSIHLTPSMPDYFKSNLYLFPWTDYSLFDKFSYGVRAEFCDNPDIRTAEYSIGGKWTSKTFLGWNTKAGYPVIKGVFKSFDGEDRITEGYVEYEAVVQRVRVCPGIRGYQYLEDGDSYSVDVSMPVRVSFGDADFERSHMGGTLSMIDFAFKAQKKAGPLQMTYSGDFLLSDKLFYSDYDFTRFENRISLSGEISGMTFGISYRGGYLYGSKESENGFSIYRGRQLMFDDKDAALDAYTVSFAYADGGYGYYSPQDSVYDALNRIRLYMGNEAMVYIEMIAKGKGIASAQRVVQAGLKIEAGGFMSIEIPFYNTDYGLILKDRIAFTVSSEFIH